MNHIFSILVGIVSLRCVTSCRLLLYFGQTAQLGDVILAPEHSIVKQSFRDPFCPGFDGDAERNHPVNLDGWGVGHFDGTKPCVYKSGSAIVDRGEVGYEASGKLLRVRDHSSRVIVAHIRAMTDGEASYDNSHPFVWRDIMFAHNGGVGGFSAGLFRQILPQYTHWLISGVTDSEHIFALLVSRIAKKTTTRENLINAVLDTIRLTLDTFHHRPSSFNFVVATSNSFVVTRYRSNGETPPSLYIMDERRSVTVASEPLCRTNYDKWIMVDHNEMVAGNFDEHGSVDVVRLCIS